MIVTSNVPGHAIVSLRRYGTLHALSTALVAVHASGLGHWQPGLNVSGLPAIGPNSAFGWLADSAFTALLADSDAA